MSAFSRYSFARSDVRPEGFAATLKTSTKESV